MTKKEMNFYLQTELNQLFLNLREAERQYNKHGDYLKDLVTVYRSQYSYFAGVCAQIGIFQEIAE